MSELDQSEMEKMVEEVLDEIENTDKQEENDEKKQEENDELITLYIKTPDGHDLNMQLSATESVQDVRSYLLEVPETCYVTCYHLELNGKVVSDYLDLSEVEELENESVLYMVEDEYNEHQAIFHVTRLKEILALSGKENDSIFQEFVSNDDVRFEGLKKLDGTVEPLLVNFFPQVTINIKCLNKIAHSGWNPPPPHRKLIGDYFYLEVDLLEESPITITSWAKGFFINQSKNNNFNPIPKDKKFKSHSLVQLLRAVSPSFADNFNVLVSKYVSPTSVDSLPPPFPRYNWLAKLEPHEYDPSRAENSLLQFSNVDYHIQGHSREWNDDYQSYKESPSNDGYERDRNIYKHYCDFVDFATKGAIEIVRGNIPPINPMEENKAHMYIFNNIFFSYAMDGRDNYKDIGGDMAAYKSASNDLLGVQLYNRVDVKGLYTLATVIIDYIGYRLVAQSIIPGLFSEKNTEENEMKLAYGSLDQKTISVNEDFHALMEEAAKKLHIKVHKVQDEEGKTYSIASHVEVKGIVGTDNRKYILDLTHPTPRDSNYPEIEHSTAILRPELIELYLLSLREKARTQKIKEWNKKVEEGKLKKEQENKEKEEKKDEVKEENKEENTEEKKEVEEKKEEVQEEEFSLDIPAPEVYFNTDLFKKTKTIYDDVNEMEQDKKLIEEVSAYLVNYLIPKLVLDAQMSLVVPVDSDSLKNTFHRLGINLRYLGRVTALALNRSNQLWELCIMEMVSRTFKHLFNENIRECTSSNLPNAVVHLLNTYFGRYTNSTEGSRSGILNEGKKEVKEENKEGNTESVQGKNKKSNSLFNLNHNDLWKTIRIRIQQKYGFELPEMIPIALFHIPMLRSICKRCGIQLKARDYDLTKEKPFILDDIISLYPVLKLAIPKTQHGENLLEAGKSFMIQGRIDYAIDYLPEALDILHQVYGPMSQETAQCLTCLAKVLFDMGNFVQAVEHQEKAVIINERVLGLDHYDTIQSYTTLAIYRLEKEEAPVPSVINFMKRSLYLSYVIGGHNNPEITPLIINTGTMLQYSGKLEEAIVYFTQALENTIKIYGDKHLETAAIYYHISVAYTLIQNYREALRMEQKNFEILSEIFDTKDKRVIESSARMKQLTKHALSEAKKSMNQEKKGRIKQNLKFPLQSQSQNPTFDQSGIFESGFLLNQTKGARKKHQVRVQRVDKDPQPEPKVQPKNQKKQNNQNNNQQNETDQTNNQKKQPNNQKKQPNNQQKQQKQPNNQQKQPNNQQKQTTNGSHKKQQNNQQQNQSKQNNQPKTEINQEDNTQPEKQQNTNNNQTNNRGGRGRGGRGNKRGGKGR